MNPLIRKIFAEFCENHDFPQKWKEPAKFEAFSMSCILSEIYPRDFNSVDLCSGGGNDRSVDSAALLINGNLVALNESVEMIQDLTQCTVTLVLVQSKTSPSFDLQALHHFKVEIERILDPTKDLTDKANAKVQDLKNFLTYVHSQPQKLAGSAVDVLIAYATTGEQISDELSEEAARMAKELNSCGQYRVETQLFTRQKLAKAYQRHQAVASVQIPYNKDHLVKMPAMTGVQAAYSGILPAQVIINQILCGEDGELRPSLFEENVREFLGYEYNEVNRGIRETLRDESKRYRFPTINNGITLVARKLYPSTTVFDLIGPQIVNGSQTCHVLYDERELLDEKVYCRITIVSSEDDEAVLDIIKGTNSQTVVSPEYIAARGDLHEVIAAYFEAQPENRRLYYERREGELRGHKQKQMCSPNELVRFYLATFLKQPYLVHKLKSSWEDLAPKVFDVSVSPVYHYAAVSLCRAIEQLLDRGHIDKKFKPLKYVLMAGAAARMRAPKPGGDHGKTAEKKLKPLIDTAWQQPDLISVMEYLFLRLNEFINIEDLSTEQLRNKARSKNFVLEFLQSIQRLG